MSLSILSTGLSGMIGTRLQEVWRDDVVVNDTHAAGVDITNSDAVEAWMRGSDAPVVLHMAAKTDVDGCEDDKIFGEEGEAWQINVRGTEYIIAAAKKTGKRMIYVSTDFVFDGVKEFYTEDDEPNPVNWYGRTKEEAERVVQTSTIPCTIVRIAYPYGAQATGKKDFVFRMKEQIEKELGWKPEHTFDTWLGKTVQWYREHEAWWKRVKISNE